MKRVLAIVVLATTSVLAMAVLPAATIAQGTVRVAASSYDVDTYDAAGMGDSVPANARTITASIGDYDDAYSESHTLHHVDDTVADVDWVKFSVTADDVNIDQVSYLLRTKSLANNMDTVIEVYGPSATSSFPYTAGNDSAGGDGLAVASNDDDPWRANLNGLAYDSALVFRPTAPGTYYVRIRPWAGISSHTYDCTAGPYQLVVKKGLLDRVYGADRIQTALAASQALFQAHLGAPGTRNAAVVVANGYNYPDALGGALLCGISDGPLLLTKQDELSPGIAEEIERLGVNRVYVVGGEAAVSDDVFAALQAINPAITVMRVAGDDRIWTAAEIANQADSDAAGYSETMPTTAILAYAYNYPDALAASAFAAARNIPILLTGTDVLAEDTDDILAHLGMTDVIIMGGTSVISTGIENDLKTRLGATHVMRIAGGDRYETAKEFASWASDLKGPGTRGDGFVGLPAAPDALLRLDPLNFGIASGQTFADALPGGVACGLSGALGHPILLNRKDTPYGYITAEHDGWLPAGDTDWVSDVHAQTASPFGPSMIFGGTAALTQTTGAILDNSVMLINTP